MQTVLNPVHITTYVVSFDCCGRPSVCTLPIIVALLFHYSGVKVKRSTGSAGPPKKTAVLPKEDAAIAVLPPPARQSVDQMPVWVS